MIATTPSPARRRLLGRTITQMAVERVHAIPGGLEIERTERFQVTRRRVLFREAFLVTLHRTAGRPLLATTIGVALLSGSLAVHLLGSGAPVAAIVAAAASAASVATAVVRAQTKIDVITLVTKRARIQVVLSARSGDARRIYEEIGEGIREARGEE